MVVTLVMAPKSVRFRRHDHLVSVLFGDLLSHSYNITFSMFLYLVIIMVVKLLAIMYLKILLCQPDMLEPSGHPYMLTGKTVYKSFNILDSVLS